jgi:hypothetical protein
MWAWLAHECRMFAQAAVDADTADLTAARHRGEAMTIDELTDYALDVIERLIADRTEAPAS